MLSRVKGTTGLALLILMSIGALSLRASASQYFAQTSIQVSTAEVDVDLRVDQDGRQYAASTLKNIPFLFKVVGITAPESQIAQVTISGPGIVILACTSGWRGWDRRVPRADSARYLQH